MDSNTFLNLSSAFIRLLEGTEREGMDKLIDWLEQTDFFTAPASSKYHGAYTSGLLEHSTNVYKELNRLSEAYPEFNLDKNSIIIVSLLHDICKVNYYAKEKRNRKNEQGQWESYDAYTVKEQFCFGGHGSKSVYLIMKYIDLTPEEATAINCHMGAYSETPQDVSKAYENCPLAWLLHVADEAATYIMEKS